MNSTNSGLGRRVDGVRTGWVWEESLALFYPPLGVLQGNRLFFCLTGRIGGGGEKVKGQVNI